MYRVYFLISAFCCWLLFMQSCAQLSGDASEESFRRSSELFQQGDYKKAILSAEESLSIKEKNLGPYHPDIAKNLNYLGELYHLTANNTKAKYYLERSLEIRKKALGLSHPDTAQCLTNLAQVLRAMGNYDEAILKTEQGLQIYKKTLGPDHPHTAASLQILASLYKDLGDYYGAANLQKQSLVINERSLGLEHAHTAISRNQLGTILYEIGEYDNALKLFEKSLEINEKLLRPGHPEIATSLNNIARIREAIGDYAHAERLYKRSLAITRNTLGPEHPRTAVCLSNIARLFMFLGEYAKAEVLLDRSLSIRETLYGLDHPKTAKGLNDLATLYNTKGEYTKAQRFLERSMLITEATFGSQHPSLGAIMSNLAFTYYQKGDHISAENLLKKSLLIYKSSLGREHPVIGNSLFNLANLYRSRGDYNHAKSLIKKSLSVMEKSLGPDHPQTFSKLNGLGEIYAAERNFSETHKLFLQVQTATSKLIDQIMGFSSGQQQLRFMATQKWNLYKAIGLVAFHMPDDHAACREIFDLWLSRKGIILEMQKRYQEALAHSDSPEIAKATRELSRIRGQLSRFVFTPPESTQVEMRKKQVFYLEEEKSKLEVKLSQISQKHLQHQKAINAKCSDIAPLLPPDTALLEFTKIRKFNFFAKSEEAWLPAHYLVFILPSGRCDHLTLHDLGPASQIDKLISQLKSEIKKNTDRGARRRLHELVFEPIQKELEEFTEIYISPDGNLNLIPFEILEDRNGEFLIENFTFNYLAAGRDLSRFNNVSSSAQKSLIIGDPDYDLSRIRSGKKSDNNRLPSGPQSTEIRGMRFNRLPGTLAEVRSISEVIGTDSLIIRTGSIASEEELFQVKVPKFLHIATHGFFLGDQDISVYSDDRDVFKKNAERAGYGYYNPLLQSGLALAGANVATHSDNENSSQGLLTAEKILGLKLRGTELVVLSACDTGLGKVQTGEGVYGLRRAFIQSGVKSLVMSMWQIPDKETKELMVQFYLNVMAGMRRNQALRQAALKQKSIVEERYGTSSPLFWGAFIFLGES